MNKALIELNQLRHKQYLMYLLVFSLVTIVIWVGVSLFASQTTSQVDPELTQLSKPLNPTIDVSTLTKLQQKTTFDPNLFNDFPIYVTVIRTPGEPSVVSTLQAERNRPLEPAPTPFPTPEPTPEPTLTPTPTVEPLPVEPLATESGTEIVQP